MKVYFSSRKMQYLKQQNGPHFWGPFYCFNGRFHVRSVGLLEISVRTKWCNTGPSPITCRTIPVGDCFIKHSQDRGLAHPWCRWCPRANIVHMVVGGLPWSFLNPLTIISTSGWRTQTVTKTVVRTEVLAANPE